MPRLNRSLWKSALALLIATAVICASVPASFAQGTVALPSAKVLASPGAVEVSKLAVPSRFRLYSGLWLNPTDQFSPL